MSSFHNFNYKLVNDLVRDSGLGDFGQRGINTFVVQHTCNAICKQIGLMNISSAANEDSNDEADDDSHDNFI